MPPLPSEMSAQQDKSWSLDDNNHKQERLSSVEIRMYGCDKHERSREPSSYHYKTQTTTLTRTLSLARTAARWGPMPYHGLDSSLCSKSGSRSSLRQKTKLVDVTLKRTSIPILVLIIRFLICPPVPLASLPRALNRWTRRGSYCCVDTFGLFEF